jgi:SAM-dependent methyltransferase
MAETAAARWREMVLANREQSERQMEFRRPDFWKERASAFAQDPSRPPDEPLSWLLGRLRPEDVVLDVGAGGGRYALPLALRVRKVVAVEPSPSMRETLEAGAASAGIGNVEVIGGRWEAVEVDAVDAAFFAHVLYDIEDVAPFLEKANRSARRLVAAFLLDTQPSVAADDLWPEIYGERRAPLPALPEFLNVLDELGWPYEQALFPLDRPRPESKDALLAQLRWRFWLEEGSAREMKLQQIIAERAVQEGDGWVMPGRRPRNVAVVAWPGSAR